MSKIHEVEVRLRCIVIVPFKGKCRQKELEMVTLYMHLICKVCIFRVVWC